MEIYDTAYTKGSHPEALETEAEGLLKKLATPKTEGIGAVEELNKGINERNRKAIEKRLKEIRQSKDMAYDMAINDKGASLKALEDEEKELLAKLSPPKTESEEESKARILREQFPATESKPYAGPPVVPGPLPRDMGEDDKRKIWEKYNAVNKEVVGEDTEPVPYDDFSMDFADMRFDKETGDVMEHEHKELVKDAVDNHFPISDKVKEEYKDYIAELEAKKAEARTKAINARLRKQSKEKPAPSPATELQAVGQVLGNLPANNLIENNGYWFFVGKVDAKLAYVTKDGKEPTEQQLKDARQVGPQLAGLRTRGWPSKEAALAALKAISEPKKTVEQPKAVLPLELSGKSEPLELPAPTAEEAKEAETAVANKLLDIPDGGKFLDDQGLSKTDRAKVWRALSKQEDIDRKSGKLQGARGFTESQIKEAISDQQAAKKSRSTSQPATNDFTDKNSPHFGDGWPVIITGLENNRLASYQNKDGTWKITEYHTGKIVSEGVTRDEAIAKANENAGQIAKTLEGVPGNKEMIEGTWKALEDMRKPATNQPLELPTGESNAEVLELPVGEKEPWQMSREEYLEPFKDREDTASEFWNELYHSYITPEMEQRIEKARKAGDQSYFSEAHDAEDDIAAADTQMKGNPKYNQIQKELRKATAARQAAENRHLKAIKQAIKEGSTISPEVLKDYPELQAKIQSQEEKQKELAAKQVTQNMANDAIARYKEEVSKPPTPPTPESQAKALALAKKLYRPYIERGDTLDSIKKGMLGMGSAEDGNVQTGGWLRGKKLKSGEVGTELPDGSIHKFKLEYIAGLIKGQQPPAPGVVTTQGGQTVSRGPHKAEIEGSTPSPATKAAAAMRPHQISFDDLFAHPQQEPIEPVGRGVVSEGEMSTPSQPRRAEYPQSHALIPVGTPYTRPQTGTPKQTPPLNASKEGKVYRIKGSGYTRSLKNKGRIVQ